VTPTSSVIFRDLGVALEEALELFRRFPLVNDDEFATAKAASVLAARRAPLPDLERRVSP